MVSVKFNFDYGILILNYFDILHSMPSSKSLAIVHSVLNLDPYFGLDMSD